MVRIRVMVLETGIFSGQKVQTFWVRRAQHSDYSQQYYIAYLKGAKRVDQHTNLELCEVLDTDST